jgi:MFS family permease
LMVCGLAAQAVLGLIYLQVTDPIEFVFLRCGEGAFAACVLPAARALVVDTVEPERRGEAYGIFGAFQNAGLLLGPALGSLLATVGYGSAFVGSCVFRTVALVIVLAMIHDTGRMTQVARTKARAVPRRSLFTPTLIGLYFLAFGDNIYFGFDLTLMPLWMRNHLGAPVAAIGLAYVVWAFPNIVVAPLGGRFADGARRSTLILAFGLAQAPMYASYGLVSTVVPAILLFGVHGAIFGLMQPAVDATLAAASPPDARARVQSVYSAVGLISAFIAANTLSALYAVNFRLPLFVMATGFGLCVLIGWTLIAVSERTKLENSRPS